jgi:hypothetical protein
MVMSIPQEPAPTTATAVERCPSCGARVRPEDTWCTLCHAPVHHDAVAAAGPDTPPRAAGVVPDEPPLEPPLEPGVARSELATAARAVVAAHERAAGGPAADPDEEYEETDEEARARQARDAETERLLEALSVTESGTLPPRLVRLSPGNHAAGAVLAVLGGCIVLAVLMAGLAVVGRFL